MRENQDIEPQGGAPGKSRGRVEASGKGAYRSPAMAWVAVGLTLLAWIFLMAGGGSYAGYLSLGVALAAVVAGFIALPGRSRAVRNIAITAIIAAMVLLVVLTAFIIVIKVGLAA